MMQFGVTSPPMFELTRDQELFILTMRNGENRFTLETLARLNEVLDEVQAQAGDGAAALIVVGEGKYWSNGIDLDWLGKADKSEAGHFVPTLNHFLGRVLSFPIPTVAALNGHAFAAGAMLALAMDFRLMRVDRGWFCLPEIDIHIPFHPAMLALIRSKLSGTTLRDATLLGKRYAASEALAAAIADETCANEDLLARAAELARPVAQKGRAIYRQMKRDLYGDVADQLQSELRLA